MIIEAVQRYNEKRVRLVSARGEINTGEFEVSEIIADTPARDFIKLHHYSGSYPAARFRFGLHRRGELVGVAVFSHPASDKVLTNVFRRPAREAVELGRLVLLDSVEANGETWFLARCFDRLRAAGLAGVLSFSDPVARTGESGRVIFPGHLGIIYRAHNARYLGRSTARTLRLLPDGRCLSDRAQQKIRRRERGWASAAEQLRAIGADEPWPDAAAWLNHWLGRLTTRLRHPGCLKYAWAFTRQAARNLPPGLAYPKLRLPEA